MPDKVALYRAARRRQRQAIQLGDALVTGVFLGLLSEDELERIDREHYETAWESVDGAASAYGSEAMVHSGLFGWERALVERHLEPGSSVAVVGAGSGREVLGLLRMGFDARGYEPHEGLVAAGAVLLEEAGHPRRLERSGRDGMPPGAADAEAILIGWGVYTLIPGRKRRIELLSAAREALRPGATVLMSFFPRSPGSRSLTASYRTAAAIRRLRGAPAVELGDTLQPNFAHFFTLPELERELMDSGLKPLQIGQMPYGHAALTVP